jgi:MoaA/NifB/PqqE/SkfB family radical SAM enzyme
LLQAKGDPNPKCVALNAHLRIFPNGDVPTCQFNSKIVGNLRRQSFAEVWSGARMAEQRRWVNACPGCWAECEVLPSAIYTIDLLKEAVRSRPRITATPQPAIT